MSINKPIDLEKHAAIEQVLNFDSVAVAEQLTQMEISAGESVELLGVGLQLNKTALLRKLMTETGDFMFSDVWKRRQSILEAHGFEPIYTYRFTGLDESNHEYMVWIEREHGLVFTQEIAERRVSDDSLEREWRNADHGKCHFCWLPASEEARTGIRFSGGYESVKNPNWRRDEGWVTPDDLYLRGYVNADGGLIHQLQSLLIKGTFYPQWPAWDDGKFPISSVFVTSEDYARYSHMDTQIFARISQARYDEMGEDLHSIMNIKRTWRPA